MKAPKRWTIPEMLHLAARGVGKVTRDGPRGATLVSMEEIEAMAGALLSLGLSPITPDNVTPPSRICFTEGERA